MHHFALNSRMLHCLCRIGFRVNNYFTDISLKQMLGGRSPNCGFIAPNLNCLQSLQSGLFFSCTYLFFRNSYFFRHASFIPQPLNSAFGENQAMKRKHWLPFQAPIIDIWWNKICISTTWAELYKTKAVRLDTVVSRCPW